MRLDKFLVVARLVKQRTRAKQLCDAGHVKIGGNSAKAAHTVAAGEVIELTLPRRRLVVTVEAIPATKSVPKAQAPTLYKILEDERTDRLV
jgi:ribosomal 50S subunit-recycling heat shock protein